MAASRTLCLPYRPPCDWPALFAFLSARAIAGVEAVEPSAYRRTAAIRDGRRLRTGWIELVPDLRRKGVRLTCSASLEPVLPDLERRAIHLMDLACDPARVARRLGALARPRRGQRVPGVFDGFEVAVRAILGQQVSVAAARTLAGRFAAKFGRRVRTPFDGLGTVFPSPEDFAGRRPAEIAVLGVIGARARSILAVARAMREGGLRLEPGGDPEDTMARLRALPGIGEWTAQYVAMRALGWKDAWPHTDLVLMKALGTRDPRRTLAAGEAWRPFRAYAVMHLWRSAT